MLIKLWLNQNVKTVLKPTTIEMRNIGEGDMHKCYLLSMCATPKWVSTVLKSWPLIEISWLTTNFLTMKNDRPFLSRYVLVPWKYFLFFKKPLGLSFRRKKTSCPVTRKRKLVLFSWNVNDIIIVSAPRPIFIMGYLNWLSSAFVLPGQ